MEELNKTKERLIELRDALYNELYNVAKEKYYCVDDLMKDVFRSIDDEINDLV